jgi:hypothetical protein
VPNYSPCVPSGHSDLDCPDIGFRVQVIGADPYLLDADNNGIGCESYEPAIESRPRARGPETFSSHRPSALDT